MSKLLKIWASGINYCHNCISISYRIGIKYLGTCSMSYNTYDVYILGHHPEYIGSLLPIGLLIKFRIMRLLNKYYNRVNNG